MVRFPTVPWYTWSYVLMLKSHMNFPLGAEAEENATRFALEYADVS